MIFKPTLPIKDEHLDLFIIDRHREYSLPEDSTLLSIREEYNGYKIHEALRHIMPEKKADEMQIKIYQAYKVEILKNTGIELEDDEEFSTILHITLWTGQGKPPIISWLNNVYNSALNAHDEASGDDDYYDYMPSYLGMVADIMKYTGNIGKANKLIKIINSIE